MKSVVVVLSLTLAVDAAANSLYQFAKLSTGSSQYTLTSFGEVWSQDAMGNPLPMTMVVEHWIKDVAGTTLATSGRVAVQGVSAWARSHENISAQVGRCYRRRQRCSRSARRT